MGETLPPRDTPEARALIAAFLAFAERQGWVEPLAGNREGSDPDRTVRQRLDVFFGTLDLAEYQAIFTDWGDESDFFPQAG